LATAQQQQYVAYIQNNFGAVRDVLGACFNISQVYWLIEHWFSLTRSHSITRVPNNLFNRDAFLLLGPAFFVMKRDWCEQK
jgi:hypothetical protein